MALDRRHLVVTLYQGGYEQRLSDLTVQASRAQQVEEGQSPTPERLGVLLEPESIRLGKQHDDLLAEAEDNAEHVTVWALSYLDFGPLQEEHPARQGDKRDEQFDVNMKTFPRALLECSLVDPPEADGLEELKTLGSKALRALGDLSQVQYMRLEQTAWQVNVRDDDLPKVSLVSLLQQQAETPRDNDLD